MAKTIKILSIDGGGIRGILPATFLAGLEELICKKSGNANARIADYFDMVAGTSTGGLLSCVYLFPDENNSSHSKYSAKQALDFYFTYGNSAFKPNASSGKKGSFHKYSPEGLELQLKLFFKDLKISQLIKPCCVAAYNISLSEPKLFLSHSASQNNGSDYYIRDILRATSALPGIFPPARIHTSGEKNYSFIDGSIFAYNPALIAYNQAKECYPDAENFFLLSLGTGHASAFHTDAKIADSSNTNWAKLLTEIAFSDHSDIVNSQLKDIYRNKPGSHYFRIQTSMPEINKEMDNVSVSNMQFLLQIGQELVKQNHKTLVEIINILTTKDNE
jgi:uncharacterized protein